MHLGLIEGPFVLHSMISARGTPIHLPKFQTAFRFKHLMSSGSKKMEPRYTFCFSLKSPSKLKSSRFPNMAPMERNAYLEGLLNTSLKFLIKISINKEIFPLSQTP